MRKWGIALDQATLQETAYSLGINKRVAEMTRAQKTELAYYQIMHATQYAQGNMARTLLTPASALRVVQTEFKQLGRAMGSIFIPMVMKVIPYIRALTQIVTELAKRIAAFFGFKISDYEFTAAPIQDIGAAFGDVEDNVNGATKALKKMLMPFDELNNVNFDTGGGSGGGIGGVGGGSLGLDTYDYDMFAGASDEINKKVEQIKNTFEKLKPIIIAVGGALAAIWAIDKIVKFKEWLDRVKKASSELSTVLELALVVGGAWLIYQGIKRAIETDWDAKSLLMMIGGTELIAVAGALKFKSPVPLRIGISLGLALGGANLLYKGIKHAIDIGTMDGESMLQILGGGSLISAAGGLLFKSPAMLTIGVLATFDIVLAASMISWWNEFFEQEKKQLYGDKKELNLGEMIYVGLNAIGEGFNKHVIEKIFGEDALKPIIDWVANVMKLFDIVKTGVKNKVEEIKKNATEKFQAFKTNVGQKVEETKNNVISNFETIKTNVKQKTEEIKNDATANFEAFKTNAGQKVETLKNDIISKFENVKTDVGQKIETLKNDVTTKFENIKTNATTKIETLKNDTIFKFENMKNSIVDKISNIKNNITNVFTNIKDSIVNKINEAKDGVRNAIDRIKSFFNFNWSLPKLKVPHLSWTTKPATGFIADILKALSLPTSLPKLNIEWYAGGGFPKEGQIFGANENGPELIGNIGRRTAVANQQQITEGISDATYTAFSRALSENRNNSESNPHIVVNIGDDKVYDGIARKENQYSNMYGVRL